MKRITVFFLSAGVLISVAAIHSCRTQRISGQLKLSDTVYTVRDAQGYPLEFHFEKGEKHNYPLMALWIEDTSGHYLQTLYVAESIAKGIFDHGETSTGKWLPGPIRRPAALPVWSHSRGVKDNDGLYVPGQQTAVPDAYSGATPVNDFVLYTKTEFTKPRVFDILFEINQTWDFNEYWTNNKYPGDEDYISSCQPSLVYRTRIDASQPQAEYELRLTGHGHYSGDDGFIYPDLSTFTTALEIVRRITILAGKP